MVTFIEYVCFEVLPYFSLDTFGPVRPYCESLYMCRWFDSLR